MPKAKSVKKAKVANNQQYIIVAVALTIAVASYFGYRTMMVKPDINKIDTGTDPRNDPRRGRGYTASPKPKVYIAPTTNIKPTKPNAITAPNK